MSYSYLHQFKQSQLSIEQQLVSEDYSQDYFTCLKLINKEIGVIHCLRVHKELIKLEGSKRTTDT